MRVLVVHKETFLPAKGRTETEHRKALAAVTACLKDFGLPFDAVTRFNAPSRRRYDLVIALGGDGTFFVAAQRAGRAPVLGVNSDPSRSLGLWTCADRRTFRAQLKRALAGSLGTTRINRMRIFLNGRELPDRPFNDVLFAHLNPGVMTRYRFGTGGRREDQKSSGVWMSTAAGSTAVIRSAGGRRMPITSRRLQYVVREPYGWPKRPRLVRGFGDRFTLTASMTGCALWIDGRRSCVRLASGDRVEIRTGGPALTVLGLDDRRRRRLFP